jgi:signal transduction histidine kinase/HAMP domain-containing protein
MGIKKKLLSSFFAIIFTLVVSGGFFMAVDYTILSKYMTLTDNMISEYRLIGKTSALMESLNKRIKSPYDASEVVRFNIIYNDTKQLVARLKIVIVDRNSQIVFSGVENNINDVFFHVESGVNSLTGGDYLSAVDHYDEASRKNSFVKENVNSLILSELDYANKLQVEIDRIRIISKGIASSFLIFALFGCIIYVLRFSKKLVLPLANLTALAKVIEAGNYKATVSDDLLAGDDEVASLANSFNTMVLSIRNSINKLQEYNKEIKKSHSLLRTEKNKLQQYLDVAGVIVLIFNSDNKVLVVNKRGRELLFVENKDIINKNWIKEFVAHKDQSKTEGLLSFLIGGTALSDTLENVIIASDKTEKNIVWHFSILENEKNGPKSVLATGVDITELTKAKITINQLKEVDKLKNEVLNIATHELKTPLVSIVGLTEVMEKQPKTTPDDYQKYISIIHNEGVKLTNLIKTMLTTSRNEVSKMTIDKEKFDLVSFVLSFETSLKMLAKRTNSIIEINLPKKKINIESDKNKISEVVYNLVDNAVKYGPSNQTVKINILSDKDTVRVEVVSAGKGISKEMQEKLFFKFSQLEPSLSRSQDGMGLGLYICKQNIESLGGKIGVISDVDQGATFYFTLPLNS